MLAGGQSIALSLAAPSRTLTLLGSATLSYSDKTQQQVDLRFNDWTLKGAHMPLAFGNRVEASMPYRNTASNGRERVKTYLFTSDVALQAGKTLSSLTLPATVSQGQMHLFALGAVGGVILNDPGSQTPTPTTTGPAISGEKLFPADAGLIDVTKAPYNAKPDGQTDERLINIQPSEASLLYFV